MRAFSRELEYWFSYRETKLLRKQRFKPQVPVVFPLVSIDIQANRVDTGERPVQKEVAAFGPIVSSLKVVKSGFATPQVPFT